MFRLIKQSLKLKIFSGFAFIFLSVIVFGVTEAGSLGRVVDDFERAQRYTHEKVEPLVVLQTKLLQSAMPVNDWLINAQPVEHDRWSRLSADIDSDYTTLRMDPANAHIKKLLDESAADWRAAGGRGILLLRNSDASPGGIATQMKSFDSLIVSAVDRLKDAQLAASGRVRAQLQTARAERRQANLLIAVIWVLTPTVSLITALWLSRNVLQPIAALHEGALRFGQGDLDFVLDLKTGDEFEALADEYNYMARRLKKSRDILSRLAIRDGLTNLYNHREFHRLLHREIERSKRSQDPLSLLMLDLDLFKQFNDSFGHRQGDKTLKLIAKIIRGQIRNIDLAARYGGEEFAVILPNANAEEGVFIAERIRAAVRSEPVIVSNELVRLSVSIGVAELTIKTPDAAALVEAADIALYAAKHQGRDRVFHDS